MIDDIAKNKFKLNQEMLRLLQEGAIDCRLNKAYNMYNIDEDHLQIQLKILKNLINYYQNRTKSSRYESKEQ